MAGVVWLVVAIDSHEAPDVAVKLAGMALVWAINPVLKSVEVFRPGQSNPVQILGINDELGGEEVIPGFKLTVKTLFD